MEQRYWSNVLNNRIGRRRAIVSTGAGALGAAFLAACGGSDSGSGGGGKKESNSLVQTPVDTSKQAKKGGVLKDRNFGDPPSLDVIQATVSWNPFGFGVYSSLVQPAPGYLKPPGEELLPDIAESWETSPDGMTLTLKIRQNVKWHNKAPVNGRAMTIDDIVYSWERMAAKGSARSGIVNKVSPECADPLVHGHGRQDDPDQAQGAPGLRAGAARRRDQRRTRHRAQGDGQHVRPAPGHDRHGPVLLANYTQSVGFNFKRNDEYWDKDWAYVDTDRDANHHRSTRRPLAQLKAGAIYRFAQNGSDIKAEDVLPLKRDEPRISVYLGELGFGRRRRRHPCFRLAANRRQADTDDGRARAAGDVDGHRPRDVPRHLPQRLEPGQGGRANRFALGLAPHLLARGLVAGPQEEKEFGPNAKYFKLDLAEAKKLLAAAGFPNGFEAPSNYVTSPELGAHPKSAEVEDGFLRDLGIKVKTNPINYTREYQPNYRDGRGQFMGWGYVAAVGSHGGSAVGRLATEFWSDGGNAFKGFSTTGTERPEGRPAAGRDVPQGPRGAGR